MLSEIVSFQTTGFWEWFNEEPRSFEVKPGGTLTVNITALTPEGQELARAAMLADVLAIHELYGKPDSINSGDTTYGKNANMGGYAEQYFKAWTGEDNPFFNVTLVGENAPTLTPALS